MDNKTHEGSVTKMNPIGSERVFYKELLFLLPTLFQSASFQAELGSTIITKVHAPDFLHFKLYTTKLLL